MHVKNAEKIQLLPEVLLNILFEGIKEPLVTNTSASFGSCSIDFDMLLIYDIESRE